MVTSDEKHDADDYGPQLLEPGGKHCARAPENWRMDVLRETLAMLGTSSKRKELHLLAQNNLAKWAEDASSCRARKAEKVRVVNADWGEAGLLATQEFGKCFAVLHTADPEYPGGGYTQGASTIEASMFYRTDCHFSLETSMFADPNHRFAYSEKVLQLLCAENGKVLFNATHPRVCIRSFEQQQGYPLLPKEQVFPFFELRAAPLSDLSTWDSFYESEMRRRITAQFETLKTAGARHVVLGDFGCNGSHSIASKVAGLYSEVAAPYLKDFDCILFAISDPETCIVFRDTVTSYLGSAIDVDEHGACLAICRRSYPDPERQARKRILLETLETLASPVKRTYFHNMADFNLRRWALQAKGKQHPHELDLRVVAMDWGQATQQVTMEFGKCFAVLNMANQRSFGGSYTTGSAAQEENMFRRSDCHFSATESDFLDSKRERVSQDLEALVSGRFGRVFLDTYYPRVCIRGPEHQVQVDGEVNIEGYDMLPLDRVFPFFELRSAAISMRRKKRGSFDYSGTRKRIEAQLDTMIEAGVRHAVLSAFGCGAFRNPADKVAKVYQECIEVRRAHFDCIVFAIYYAGYGQDNYSVFKSILAP